MIIFLIIALIISFFGAKLCEDPQVYLSKEETTAVKGLFIILVFLNHARSYLTLEPGYLNDAYALFFQIMGQMIVVMFLFYSGYGISISFFSKKKSYLDSFLLKRIFLTWLHFAMAIILFAIVAVVLGMQYSMKQWVLCWIGYESIGNSNWYIFDIILLYIISFFAMRISFKEDDTNKTKYLLTIGVGALLMWLGLFILKAPSRFWYDTIMAFPIGAVYYVYKEQIEKNLQKQFTYIAILIGSIIIFGIFIFVRNSIGGNIQAISFSIIIVSLTYKFKMGNRVLNWFGHNLFPIFILQRIPMNVLEHYNVHEYPYLFIIVSLFCTIILVIPYQIVCNKVDKLVIRK